MIHGILCNSDTTVFLVTELQTQEWAFILLLNSIWKNTDLETELTFNLRGTIRMRYTLLIKPFLQRQWII